MTVLYIYIIYIKGHITNTIHVYICIYHIVFMVGMPIHQHPFAVIGKKPDG